MTTSARIAKNRPDTLGTVTTDDGIDLAVTRVGPTAPVTAVFCHGLGLHSGVWAPQRIQLMDRWRGRARMVFYDHRGHGASGPAPTGTATIDRLARDLGNVIDAVAPDGPLLLIGHSMGGMGILALAATQRLLAERIAGVGLLSTTAGLVASAGLTRILDTRVHRVLQLAADHAPSWLDQCWTVTRHLAAPLVGPRFCGETATSARFVAEARTDITTIVELLTDMKRYDGAAALPILRDIPATVVCGRRDRLLPVEHSRRLAVALPNAELVILPAAHMIGWEAPTAVNAALDFLLRRFEHRVHAWDGVPDGEPAPQLA